MLAVLLVALGGALGSISRYLTVRYVQSSVVTAFPWGTLVVNAGGCLLIGLLFGFADGRAWFSTNLRGLLSVGFLGGFTTYSAFSYETVTLARNGLIAQAVLNVALQLFVGIAAVAIGLSLAHLARPS